MSLPRVGVGLPILGCHASPESLLAIAIAADQLGFSSVSTADRLLLPAAEDWQNVAGLPEDPAYDVLESLTFVASQTRQVKLMTGVVNSIFYPPVLLARRLASLDALSNGRVVAGLGQGWMPEEFAVVGVPMSRRGAGFEEHLTAMRACWGPDPVEHPGPRYPIPRSKLGPKPVNGSIPVLIGAVMPTAVARAARIGDGFMAAFRDWDGLTQHLTWYREAGGRGTIVLRAGPMVGIPLDSDTAPWSQKSVLSDLARVAELGVDEVIWDLNINGTAPERQIAAYEWLAAELRS